MAQNSANSETPAPETQQPMLGKRPDFTEGVKAAKIFGVLVMFCVIAFTTAVLVGKLLVPRSIRQQQSRAEIDVIESLRRIHRAQQEVFERDADENGVQDYVTLKTLGALKRVGGLLAGGMRNGYHYQAEPGQASAELYWWAKASPDKDMKSQAGYFFINQDGEIYSSLTDFPVDRLKATVPLGLNRVLRRMRKQKDP